MLLSERVRRAGFWIIDFLTGSRVRRHYSDIRNIMENYGDPNVSKNLEGYLRDILTYATENVEFYKQFKTFNSLRSFPVINKNIIRDNYEAFQSPEFLKAAVEKMHTSGSTGTPFVVRHDMNKRARVYAEMMYFWGKAGYQIGMRYVFFRVWTPLNRKSKLTTWARNLVMVDIRNLDERRIRHLLRSDRRIKMLIGYVPTLDSLGIYLKTCGDIPEMYNLRTIIGFGEAFPEKIQRRLKKVFGCNVISLYSNQENGMLAVECVDNKEFHVNRASYYIELLKIDSDEPVSVEEPGRIVVTDLFNHAMPLIRYDTGDIGTWKKETECGWQSQLLSSIQGSMVDPLFDTKGKIISSDEISVNLWLYDKVLQFQFVQEGAKLYVLKLNGAKGNYDDALFVKLVKDVVGEDAEVVIEHVDGIPVLESGKRKIVVNDFLKSKS
jgi:phenylacetate-CoA ligase